MVHMDKCSKCVRWTLFAFNSLVWVSNNSSIRNTGRKVNLKMPLGAQINWCFAQFLQHLRAKHNLAGCNRDHWVRYFDSKTRHAWEKKHANYLGFQEPKLCIILLSVLYATYSVRLIGRNRRNIVIQTIFKIVYKSCIDTPGCGRRESRDFHWLRVVTDPTPPKDHAWCKNLSRFPVLKIDINGCKCKVSKVW